MELYNWLFGIVGDSILWMVLFTLLTTHLTFLAVTIYLHRYSSHRALELHPAAKHVFRFWLWLTTGMDTKEWTAIHRKHHANTETEDDPHSPAIHGLPEILFKGTEYYRAAVDDEMLERYGRGTPDDWLERNLYSVHVYWGISMLMVIDILLFGLAGVPIWAVQMMWTPFLAAGVINGVGHAIGYRNFESPDVSTNIVPWGILICGEELHNNHHTYPNSARFSVKPWEFDWGWQVIRLMTWLKLAKPLSTGPVVERDADKFDIDIDTIWAVINDRYSIMAKYADKVVAPLVKSAQRDGSGTTRRVLRRARKILCRDDLMLKSSDRHRISEITGHSPLLKVIYEKRVELSEFCAKRSGSREELLKTFREWCTSAEATGIDVLQKFVLELRSYTVRVKAPATS